jgi:hypothetical protein
MTKISSGEILMWGGANGKRVLRRHMGARQRRLDGKCFPGAIRPGRCGHAMCQYGDDVLMFGGKNTGFGGGGLNDTWLYDVGAATWTEFFLNVSTRSAT